MAASTTAAAMSGIGSPVGMADQSSLPSIGRSEMRLGSGRGHMRPRTWRQLLGDNVVEQQRIIDPINRLAGYDGLLCQRLVAVRIEHAIALRGALDPIRKCERRNHVDVKQHVGKAVAAEMGGET